MFSKIERGDRRAKRTQVIQIANYFNIDEKELLTLWVADKVLDAVEDEEELKSDAIKVAQSSIALYTPRFCKSLRTSNQKFAPSLFATYMMQIVVPLYRDYHILSINRLPQKLIYSFYLTYM